MSEDIERLLADLDSEDTEDGDEVSSNRPKNPAIKQLRDHAKRLERDLAKERKEREAIAARVEEYETRELKTTLSGAGLNERQIVAYEKLYGRDVNPENVTAFRRDILGVQEEGSTFEPTIVASDGSAAGKRISKQEFKAIMAANPGKGMELMRAGLVDF